MSMLAQERHDFIARRLEQKGRVIAAELARELDISEDTIRRDLRDLSSRGVCRRVYGGALKASPATGRLADRVAVSSAAKTELAHTAIEWVEQGATIFFDAASTNLAIAQVLPRDYSLTCITNAPQIADALTRRGDCDVVVIGGLIHRDVGAAVGAEAMAAVSNIRPDICFLGACGADPEAGLTAIHADDASFKRAISESSGVTIAAVTNEKLMTAAPFRVMPLDRCMALIVESDAPEEAIAACTRAGATVRRAHPDLSTNP